ncbi:MAG TPA: hypothetical protein VG797_11505 [Phycisphaerales bacterium]|nr:hypothetical protein [Phycisphaerales bacterium]
MLNVSLTGLTRKRMIAWIAALALVVLSAPASFAQQGAQSEADLRRENDQLKQQLQESQKRVQTLQAEVERLRKMIAAKPSGEQSPQGTNGGGGSAPAGENKDAFEPPPADPLASPASMFVAVVKSYETELTPLPRETKAEQARFTAEAKKWAAKTTRDIRGRAEWTVDSVKVLADARGEREVEFRVISPATGKAYGPPVTVKMRADLAQKLANQPPEGRWKIAGMASAAPKVKPEYERPGAFDAPQKFVGPCVEFELEFSALSVMAADAKKP